MSNFIDVRGDFAEFQQAALAGSEIIIQKPRVKIIEDQTQRVTI